jgi:uncharacterized protein (DUF2147 family)
MKSQRAAIAVAAIAAIWGVALSGGTTPAPAQEPTAAGLWQRLGDDKKPSVWFLVAERGGVFEGYAVKLFSRPGEEKHEFCTHCTDDRKGAPLLGLPMIRGMKRTGLSYEGGTVLDPRNGNIWRAMMTLKPEKSVLTMRGYLLIPTVGVSEDWDRLPDAAYKEVDPALIAKYAPERLETKKGKAKK